MFDDAMGALDHIEDVTQNTDSEDYGRIGTNSYKAAVDFIVPDSVDTEDAEAVWGRCVPGAAAARSCRRCGGRCTKVEWLNML